MNGVRFDSRRRVNKNRDIKISSVAVGANRMFDLQNSHSTITPATYCGGSEVLPDFSRRRRKVVTPNLGTTIRIQSGKLTKAKLRVSGDGKATDL